MVASFMTFDVFFAQKPEAWRKIRCGLARGIPLARAWVSCIVRSLKREYNIPWKTMASRMVSCSPSLIDSVHVCMFACLHVFLFATC